MQWDYEAWLESGVSLWPLPFHSVLWLGYRWRTLNDETTRRPGDELTFLAEVGGTRLLGGLGAKVLVDGTFGRAGEIQGIRLGSGDERRILYLGPALSYEVTESVMVEVGIRIPLLGRNFPAGAPLQVVPPGLALRLTGSGSRPCPQARSVLAVRCRAATSRWRLDQ